jgi:hypothetical protein
MYREEMEKEIDYDSLAKKTTKELKETYTKELDVLTQNLKSVEGSDKVILLPSVIHNICVCTERKTHLFLPYINQLYRWYDESKFPPIVADQLSTASNSIVTLIDKEDDYLEEQMKELELIRKQAERDGSEFDIEREIEYLSHIECDLSPYVQGYIYCHITNAVAYNEEQMRVFDDIRKLCIYILKDAIKTMEEGLKKIDLMLCEE